MDWDADAKRPSPDTWLVAFKVANTQSLKTFSREVKKTEQEVASFLADAALDYAGVGRNIHLDHTGANGVVKGRLVVQDDYILLERRCKLTDEALALLKEMDEETVDWKAAAGHLKASEVTRARPYLLKPDPDSYDDKLPANYESCYAHPMVKMAIISIFADF